MDRQGGNRSSELECPTVSNNEVIKALVSHVCTVTVKMMDNHEMLEDHVGVYLSVSTCV